MDPITIGLLIGAATGMLKGGLDEKKEASQRKETSAAQKWSPWTHMQGGPIQRADPLGSTMQGALAGAAVGQGYKGGDASAPTTLATSNSQATQGAAFNGTGPTMANQNGAAGSAIDYANPNAAVYNPSGMAGRPAYVPPGQQQRSAWGAIGY